MPEVQKFKKEDILVGKDYKYPEGALRVHEVKADGSIVVYPEGGGFQMTFSPEAQAKNKLRKVPDSELKNPPWKQIQVTLDYMWEDHKFSLKCWTQGGRWNGWQCPDFEFAEAMRLVNYMKEEENGDITLHYDEEKDAFIITDPQYDDPEERFTEFKGEEVTINGKKVKVYSIGSGYWTWSEAPADEPDEDVGDQED